MLNCGFSCMGLSFIFYYKWVYSLMVKCIVYDDYDVGLIFVRFIYLK